MKDFIGNDIEVGDTMVHASAVSGGLSKSIVVKLTEKRVGVESRWSSSGLAYYPPENCVVIYKVEGVGND